MVDLTTLDIWPRQPLNGATQFVLYWERARMKQRVGRVTLLSTRLPICHKFEVEMSNRNVTINATDWSLACWGEWGFDSEQFKKFSCLILLSSYIMNSKRFWSWCEEVELFQRLVKVKHGLLDIFTRQKIRWFRRSWRANECKLATWHI